MIARSVLFVLCMVGILTGEAKAQLFLDNGKVTLAVSGGDHLNGSLLIHNLSSSPINVRAYWEDFQYVSPYDGSKKFLPAGTTPASASQWVTYTPQTFSIPASGQQNVDYTVTVPSSAQGGHYGVLFFEVANNAPAAEGDVVTLVTRVGCLFFIEAKDKNKNAAIQGIKLKGKSISANFVNQGNVVLIPHTTFYVMQEGGLVLNRGEAKNLYVPPGSSAPLEIPLKKQLNPGQYTLVVNSDLEEGDVVLKEIGLTVDASGQITIENSRD
jgi:hypothetical protein